ncbi:AIPR family protein [Solibacillus sp. FSL H8-0538]|uniref:AIPR family protein n=1 Tax=Solibacillus sp. FSL H8-0538 TaxID=2921400 RepID=UPI0030FB5FD5
MFTIKDFHQDFLQSILSDTESRGLLKPQSFFELFCQDLVDVGDLSKNYTAASYYKTGVEVYGYDYDEERKLFTLINFQFFQSDEITTLNRQQIQTKFNRLKKFIVEVKNGLHLDLEETSDGYELAFKLFHELKAGHIEKFRLMVLTDGNVTRTISEIPSESIDDIGYDYRVIDINYLYKIYASQMDGASYEIDTKIPCLPINNDSDDYQAYLSILNGEQLYEIYDEYGQKLLEQNVRTFLQFKGGVNKGIKNTIENRPELFFAYNNGITATATSVEYENGFITKLVDFQIVNGGQTTSAIYAAKKNSKLDISKVKVQMKLSVVKEIENKGQFVSKVSEYANTQNKVNKSDFFSNSPFHKEMKDYSKRIWAAASGGSQLRTHWYYERVRGEYLNEQAYLTTAKKKQFVIEHPKKQLIDKTLLAKSENTWLKKPWIVSKGAQYSFAEFAEQTTEKLEKDALAITESYFKESIARIILFKATENIISKADWYENAYRAQTVTYAIAYLAHLCENQKLYLNFLKIWEEQIISTELIEIMKAITREVYELLMDPPGGFKNVGEWCKKEQCWHVVKNADMDIVLPKKLVNTKQETQYVQREERETKKVDKGIELQTFVVTMNFENWMDLFAYYSRPENRRDLSVTQRDILMKYTEGKIAFPSEKQCKILYDVYQKASEVGWEPGIRV